MGDTGLGPVGAGLRPPSDTYSSPRVVSREFLPIAARCLSENLTVGAYGTHRDNYCEDGINGIIPNQDGVRRDIYVNPT